MQFPIRSALAIAAIGILSAAVPASASRLAGYGLRTGVALSGTEGDNSEWYTADPRPGFAGGLFARFSLGSWLSLQPEFGWASKGAKGSFSVTSMSTGGPVQYETYDVQFEDRRDYFEIPLLVRADIRTGWFLEPYVIGGPGVAFRTGSDRSVSFTSTTQNVPASAKVRYARIFENVGTFDDPRFETVDWSVIGGAGFSLGRGPLRVVMDARFTQGLSGIYSSVDASGAPNASWAATLGIELR
jgi:hypothetical protein